jgi:ABC-2 type transport system ATP-binding protein
LINHAQKVLEGEKETIKASFSTNTYSVLANEVIDPEKLGINGVELSLEKSYQQGKLVKNLLKANVANLNDLISLLIPHYELHEIKEHIPSMDEIFIKLVGKEDN